VTDLAGFQDAAFALASEDQAHAGQSRYVFKVGCIPRYAPHVARVLCQETVDLILGGTFVLQPGRLIEQELNRVVQVGLVLFDHHQIVSALIENLLAVVVCVCSASIVVTVPAKSRPANRRGTAVISLLFSATAVSANTRPLAC